MAIAASLIALFVLAGLAERAGAPTPISDPSTPTPTAGRLQLLVVPTPGPGDATAAGEGLFATETAAAPPTPVATSASATAEAPAMTETPIAARGGGSNDAAGHPSAPPANPVAPIYWGVNMPTIPWNMDNLASWESKVAGKAVSIINYGHFWGDGSAKGYREFTWSLTPLNNIRAHGAIPMITWTPEGGDPRRWQLRKIIRGDHDDYIRRFALGLRDWPTKDRPAPVFLRLMHEMNGNWGYPWQEDSNGNHRGEFVQAWRHIVDIFRQEKVYNATFVWCPNAESPGSTSPSFASLYPEAEQHPNYVDWTCLDGYNRGSSQWESFNQLFTGSYNAILNLSHAQAKPMMVGEWGSVEKGGSKASWFADALSSQIPDKFTQVRAIVYYNFADGPYDWHVETTQASQDAFKAAIAAPYYMTNVYGALLTSPIPVP
jgi:mannan endo-1,4-beta-mannosidase